MVNYFDDFPHVDLEDMAVRSQVVMEEALRTMAWGIAEETKKRTPRRQGSSWCLAYRVPRTGCGVVRNKEDRVTALENTIEDMEVLRDFPPGPVKHRALMHRGARNVAPEIRQALRLSANLLRSAPPRRLDAVNQEAPCLAFTDGAYEDGRASCGAAVFSPRLEKPLAFGFEVPEEVVAEWHGFGHEHVVAQAEMMPIVIVKQQFAQLLRGARVLDFIDNEGVKEALVAGVTKSEGCRKMLVEAMIQDANNNSLNWYTRIPSPSNVADAPSRLRWDILNEMLDYVRVTAEFDYSKWGIIRVV